MRKKRFKYIVIGPRGISKSPVLYHWPVCAQPLARLLISRSGTPAGRSEWFLPGGSLACRPPPTHLLALVLALVLVLLFDLVLLFLLALVPALLPLLALDLDLALVLVLALVLDPSPVAAAPVSRCAV